ncbi:MAG: adenylyl-sulfate kinase, partial [Myxococcales bacterium]|nr:adenylyl-sulfate kinase [Myxococcales bacterium]
QDVYKFNRAGDERRIVAGRIAAGRVAVGDQVVFSPSNKLSTVASIEAFNAPTATAAEAPDCVGITLTEQIFVQRGELCSHLDDRPQVSTRFRANLVWLGRKPLALGGEYKLKLATCETNVRVAEIQSVLDASDLTTDKARTEVRRHEVAEVVLEAKRPVAFDLVERFENTARFVLVDQYDVAGGGIILEGLADALAPLREEARSRDFEWVEGHVTQRDRAERFGHEPVLVLLTGNAGVGKAAIARRLERMLFDRGDAVYLLDGRNVYLGVDRDLAASMNKAEMVRRYAEVAYLFLDAGQIVVSTSNTFALADHAAIRTLIGANHVLHVHVGEEPGDADIVFDEAVEAEGAAREIVTHLAQEGWLVNRPD